MFTRITDYITLQIRSEKNLPICDETSVCSVLHKRYWLPPIADRLCRCVNNDECPWRWATEPDNYTMMLNNRAQLKVLYLSVLISISII